ncbi:hypothetical protein QQY66_01310 [Streptomyces sp. DG2A-72]|uniref:hypothetical protein n=1 Tax=Streptomyces sp. DG2A-72 TaxID=3051386 RepID=UPI00265B8C00|nr:hypothetical protein [Streptomyces sp. DG2A-72]MDO0930400.1 hypothetical protein [Streptomyces sp. DG2A-72]
MIETDSVVPLPNTSIPAGVSDWTTKDAGRWAALHPPRWARPLWPALLTLATALAAAFLPATGPACSRGNPCGADSLGVCLWGLLLGLVLWSLRFPELVLLTFPALAVVVAAETFPLPGGVYTILTGAVLAASGAACGAAAWRLVARRRQRLAATQVAGASRHRVPGAAAALLRGTIRIVVALALLGIAAGAVGMALRGVRDDARRSRGADHLTGRVVARGDTSIRVRAAGATRTVGAQSPQDYKPGQRVDVLVAGRWAQLAAEPYAPVGWQLLTLGTALPALTLLASGIRARRRDAVLLRRPVPVLRAMVVFDGRGDAWIRPVDEASTQPTFLRSWVEPLGKGTGDGAVAGSRADSPQGQEAGDEDTAVADGRPREALVYGALRAGAPMLLVTAAPDQGLVVLRSGPLALPRPGALPRTDRPGAPRSPAPERVHEAGGRLSAGGGVRRWGPGTAARAGAAFIVLAAAAMILFQVVRMRSGAGIGSGAPLLWVAVATWSAPVLGGWRITADADGVWLTGVWKVRHIRWEQMTRVAHTGDGAVEISGSGGVQWRRANMGRRRPGRSRGVRPAHLRAAEEIAAMHAHPELRPGENSRPRYRGVPLGPVLAAFYLLWTAAAFLL